MSVARTSFYLLITLACYFTVHRAGSQLTNIYNFLKLKFYFPQCSLVLHRFPAARPARLGQDVRPERAEADERDHGHRPGLRHLQAGPARAGQTGQDSGLCRLQTHQHTGSDTMVLSVRGRS